MIPAWAWPGAALGQPWPAAATYVVSRAADQPDAQVGDGVCAIAGGGCTLRAAIQESNAAPPQQGRANYISFADVRPAEVSGISSWRVKPGRRLPAIKVRTVVDGYTAPGYDDGDASPIPVVVVDGGRLSEQACSFDTACRHQPGVWVQGQAANGSVIRGLRIQGFPGSGLTLHRTEHFVVEGNYIGTWSTGRGGGNGGAGVFALRSRRGRIGTAADSSGRGNLVGGNGTDGILVSGADAYHTVHGNLIGTNRQGEALGNGTRTYSNAITSFGREIAIGTARAGNLVADQNGNGISLAGRANERNVVQGNQLGFVRLPGGEEVALPNGRVPGTHCGVQYDGAASIRMSSGKNVIGYPMGEAIPAGAPKANRIAHVKDNRCPERGRIFVYDGHADPRDAEGNVIRGNVVRDLFTYARNIGEGAIHYAGNIAHLPAPELEATYDEAAGEARVRFSFSAYRARGPFVMDVYFTGGELVHGRTTRRPAASVRFDASTHEGTLTIPVPAGQSATSLVASVTSTAGGTSPLSRAAVLRKAGRTFAVNTTADQPDAVPGDGACRTAAGTCTFRAALEETNASPTVRGARHRITFEEIPTRARGAQGRPGAVITMKEAVDPIYGAVVIDGRTAPGYARSFYENSSFHRPVIAIALAAQPRANSVARARIAVASRPGGRRPEGKAVLRGLALYGSTEGEALLLNRPNGYTVTGTEVGAGPSSQRQANAQAGVTINAIGAFGPATLEAASSSSPTDRRRPAQPNVIVGNGGHGVEVTARNNDGDPDGAVRLLGNYVGVLPGGTPAPNEGWGLYYRDDVPGPVRLGVPAAPNVIAANAQGGVRLKLFMYSGARYDASMFVQSNYIGVVPVDGALVSAGNGGAGVSLEHFNEDAIATSHPFHIGYGASADVPAAPAPALGAVGGRGNVIAHNEGPGVFVAREAGGFNVFSFRGNQVFENAGGGVQVENDLMKEPPAPVIEQTRLRESSAGAVAEVTFQFEQAGYRNASQSESLESRDGEDARYTIDFYVASTSDEGTSPQGRYYVGTARDVSYGALSSVMEVPIPEAVEPGALVAYATSPEGQTGERGATAHVRSESNASEGTSSEDNTPEGTLPVEVDRLSVRQPGPGVVSLQWTALSETNNASFEVQRCALEAQERASTGPVPPGDACWERALRVEGRGTTQTEKTYAERLDVSAPGTWAFKVVSISENGTRAEAGQTRLDVALGASFRLDDPFPNPLRSRAQARLWVEREQHVTAELYDALGRRVKRVWAGTAKARATNRLSLSAAGLASGTYFLRVAGETFQATKPVVVVH